VRARGNALESGRYLSLRPGGIQETSWSTPWDQTEVRAQQSGWGETRRHLPWGSAPFGVSGLGDRSVLVYLTSTIRSQGFSPSQRFDPARAAWFCFAPHPPLGFWPPELFPLSQPQRLSTPVTLMSLKPAPVPSSKLDSSFAPAFVCFFLAQFQIRWKSGRALYDLDRTEQHHLVAIARQAARLNQREVNRPGEVWCTASNWTIPGSSSGHPEAVSNGHGPSTTESCSDWESVLQA